MSAAAKGLYEKLEQMRLELFIIALQHPRLDETVVLHLYALRILVPY